MLKTTFLFSFWLLIVEKLVSGFGIVNSQNRYFSRGSSTSTFILAASTALKAHRQNALAADAGARSKRVRFLNKIGFKRLSKDKEEIRAVQSSKPAEVTYDVATVGDLEAYFDDKFNRFRDENGEINYESLLKSLSVVGDTQKIGSKDHPDYVHPVAKLLHERKRNGSVCTGGSREDGCKVALVVEGGGMRGCISAGMVIALEFLGLRDTFDVVYGSSAGSIIGSYFMNGQTPYFGPELYYDKLPTAGTNFIDTKRLLRSLGFGLLDPRLLKDVLVRPSNGKPVLNLSYLLEDTLQRTKPLDWDKFVERLKVQPLKVVASALRSGEAVVMEYAKGNFTTLDELSKCMHASCLLPGIAGPVMNVKKDPLCNDGKPKFVLGNNLNDPSYEPLGDALVYGPIPFEVAIKEGATHAVVIRSRPDGTDVTGNGGIFERLIMRRFFLRKNRLPVAFDQMSKHLHKKVYAESVIKLNEESKSERDYKDKSKPHLLALALPPGSKEVARLETGRQEIFDGVRRGFARAYDALVEDPKERGRGMIVAKELFPDEIMDYDPCEITTVKESAFEYYLRKSGVTPKAWQLNGPPKQVHIDYVH